MRYKCLVEFGITPKDSKTIYYGVGDVITPTAQTKKLLDKIWQAQGENVFSVKYIDEILIKKEKK